MTLPNDPSQTDHELSVLFAEQAATVADRGFSDAVLARIAAHRRRRQRWLLAAWGAALAGASMLLAVNLGASLPLITDWQALLEQVLARPAAWAPLVGLLLVPPLFAGDPA